MNKMIRRLPFAILLFSLAVNTLLSTNAMAQEEEPQTAEQSDTDSNISSDTDESDSANSNTVTRIDGKVKRERSPATLNQQMQLLEQYMPDRGNYWIENGNERFFAIWEKDRSGQAKGAVLIIHADGEHPSWPQTTKPLHDTLPDYGWATMAISLPSSEQKAIPKRTFPVKTNIREPSLKQENQDDENEASANNSPPPNETAETPQNNTSNESLSDTSTTSNKINTEVIAEERLTAAIKFLHDKGQFNIVIMGSGIGALRAHDFLKSITPVITDKKLKDRIEKPVRAFIMFNARNRFTTAADDYKDWFFDPEIPVLDIYTTTDRRNLYDVKKRGILAKQDGALEYSQARVSEMSFETSWGENRLSRRIRSFLDARVQGVEVENATIKN